MSGSRDLSIDDWMHFTREALANLSPAGGPVIDVSSVRLVDETLTVEIVAPKEDPWSVRGEIAGVMGGLDGWDLPSLSGLRVRNYGVRANNAKGEQIMWIVSSLDASRHVGEGRPIEWLNGSIVSDATPAAMRGMADRRIGQVEVALRDLAAIRFERSLGSGWPIAIWTTGELKDLQKMAIKEGADPDDGRDLLDYTYLPDLSKLLSDHWGNVSDALPSNGDFAASMKQLNPVRRKVAHHREVSSADYAIVEAAAAPILGAIGAVEPAIVVDFVSERWDSEVSRALDEASSSFNRAGGIADDGLSLPEPERREAMHSALKTQLAAIEGVQRAASLLVAPPTRIRLLDELSAALERWRSSLESVVSAAGDVTATPAQIVEAAAAYDAALAEVGSINARIRAIRLGLA